MHFFPRDNNLSKSTPFLFHFIVRIFLVLTYLNQEIRGTWLPDDKSPIVFLNFRIFCNKYIDLRNELIFIIAYPLACEFSLLLFGSDTISIEQNIDICLKVLWFIYNLAHTAFHLSFNLIWTVNYLFIIIVTWHVLFLVCYDKCAYFLGDGLT